MDWLLRMKEHGAKFRFQETAVKWKATASDVTVTTDKCTYTAKKLILTCGRSIGSLVPELKVHSHFCGALLDGC